MKWVLGSAMVLAFLGGVLTGCPKPPPGSGGGPGGGGGGGVNPNACGNISTSDVGRKMQNFLIASAELDAAASGLELSVLDACRKMANELGVSAEGDTRTVCNRAADELKANLQVSVSSETRVVTRYKEPVCHTKVEFAAQIAAQCEAKVQADVQVQCTGYCGGTCNGACDGQCSGATGQGGQCAGQCQGTCRGSCSADCQGSANVNASAECKASAEVRANIKTECEPPQVEMVTESVTVVDASKLDKAKKAIAAGLPQLLAVGARAKIVGQAIVYWGQTLGSLVKSGASLIKAIGEKGICVVGQLSAAFAAVAQVEAHVSISIEVSASVSASAGGQAQ